MRKILFMTVFCALTTTFPVQHANAQGNETKSLTSNNVLEVKSVYETTDNVLNYKNFEVQTFEAGDYYVNFWLQPTRYANGKFSTFKVYVNGTLSGSVKPTVGNWQSASVEAKPALQLKNGINTISIATNAPEVPNVESVKISRNMMATRFQSAGFNSYLRKAVSSDGTPDVSMAEMTESDSRDAAGIKYFTHVPLKYSFYRTFSFTKGQEIFITSTSRIAHKIDMVYYGKQILFPANSPQEGLFPTIPIGDMKPQLFYTPATSEEMQGLNWGYLSEKALNNPNNQIATLKVKIPKTGMYLIKLRSAGNGVLSVADLNVNGNYFYENTPIYFSNCECEIPADGNEYATMTNCNTPGTDDPMLFIEGYSAKNVVGFNDDGPYAKLNQYNLSNRDSYISLKYFVKTKGIHVANYSSYKPESKCNILARVRSEANVSAFLAPAQAKHDGTTDVSKIERDSQLSITPYPANLMSDITISSGRKISKVEVYDMSGVKLSSVKVNALSATLSLSSLNIKNGGVYAFSVTYENGMETKKIFVK